MSCQYCAWSRCEVTPVWTHVTFFAAWDTIVTVLQTLSAPSNIQTQLLLSSLAKNFRAVRAYTSPFLTVFALGFACLRHALLLLRPKEDKNKRLAHTGLGMGK